MSGLKRISECRVNLFAQGGLGLVTQIPSALPLSYNLSSSLIFLLSQITVNYEMILESILKLFSNLQMKNIIKKRKDV